MKLLRWYKKLLIISIFLLRSCVLGSIKIERAEVTHIINVVTDIINHSYLIDRNIQKDWKNILSKNLKIYNHKDFDEFILNLMKLIGQLRVSHVKLNVCSYLYDSVNNIKVEYAIDNKIIPLNPYITEINLNVKPVNNGLKIGFINKGDYWYQMGIRKRDVIISVKDLKRSQTSICPTSKYDLAGFSGNRFEIKVISSDNQVKKYNYTYTELKYNYPNRFLIRKDTDENSIIFKQLSYDIGYLKINDFLELDASRLYFLWNSNIKKQRDRETKVLNCFKCASNCKTLLIDLRKNSGGSLGCVAEILFFIGK